MLETVIFVIFCFKIPASYIHNSAAQSSMIPGCNFAGHFLICIVIFVSQLGLGLHLQGAAEQWLRGVEAQHEREQGGCELPALVGSGGGPRTVSLLKNSFYHDNHRFVPVRNISATQVERFVLWSVACSRVQSRNKC